jgi:hypothetical protein
VENNDERNLLCSDTGCSGCSNKSNNHHLPSGTSGVLDNKKGCVARVCDTLVQYGLCRWNIHENEMVNCSVAKDARSSLNIHEEHRDCAAGDAMTELIVIPVSQQGGTGCHCGNFIKSALAAIGHPSLVLSVILMSNKDYYGHHQQQPYYPPQGANFCSDSLLSLLCR